MKKASFYEVAEWVNRAWNVVTPEVIKSGFWKLGLTCHDEDFRESNSETKTSAENECQREALSEENLKHLVLDTNKSDFNDFLTDWFNLYIYQKLF